MVLAVLISLGLSDALPNGGGNVSNVTPSVTSGLTGDKSSLNNNANVDEVFTFQVFDPNGEGDFAKVKIVSTQATFGTKERTIVGGDLSQTSEPGAYDENGWKVWNPTANDGYLQVKFKYTWPSGTATGTYTQTASVQDEGAYVAGATTDTTQIMQAIGVADDPVLANGNAAAGAYWGAWTAAPGATLVESGNYLKVTNTGASATQQFTIDFTPAVFTGVSDASWTTSINNQIKFAAWEDTSPGTTAPNEGTYTFGSVSATGSASFSFTGTGNVIYVAYRLEALSSPLKDQAYSAAFTVTES